MARQKIGVGQLKKITLSEEEWKMLDQYGDTTSQAIRVLLLHVQTLRRKMDLPPFKKEWLKTLESRLKVSEREAINERNEDGL